MPSPATKFGRGGSSGHSGILFALNGHYSSSAKRRRHYRRLAVEINTACESGQIPRLATLHVGCPVYPGNTFLKRSRQFQKSDNTCSPLGQGGSSTARGHPLGEFGGSPADGGTACDRRPGQPDGTDGDRKGGRRCRIASDAGGSVGRYLGPLARAVVRGLAASAGEPSDSHAGMRRGRHGQTRASRVSRCHLVWRGGGWVHHLRLRPARRIRGVGTQRVSASSARRCSECFDYLPAARSCWAKAHQKQHSPRDRLKNSN